MSVKTEGKIVRMCRQITLLFFAGFLLISNPALAQTNTSANTNLNDKNFKLVVCDGPTLPKNVTPPKANYVPCDFKGIMLQVQHIINLFVILGVFVAIGMFIYAGFLYLSGKPGNIDKAHSIFPKVFFGFIIMLSAWFIVYQILSWLTDNPAFKALLGK